MPSMLPHNPDLAISRYIKHAWYGSIFASRWHGEIKPLRDALFKVSFELIADIALSNLRIIDAIALTIAPLASAAVANFGAQSQ
jgi:hypothetical protein